MDGVQPAGPRTTTIKHRSGSALVCLSLLGGTAAVYHARVLRLTDRAKWIAGGSTASFVAGLLMRRSAIVIPGMSPEVFDRLNRGDLNAWDRATLKSHLEVLERALMPCIGKEFDSSPLSTRLQQYELFLHEGKITTEDPMFHILIEASRGDAIRQQIQASPLNQLLRDWGSAILDNYRQEIDTALESTVDQTVQEFLVMHGAEVINWVGPQTLEALQPIFPTDTMQRDEVWQKLAMLCDPAHPLMALERALGNPNKDHSSVLASLDPALGCALGHIIQGRKNEFSRHQMLPEAYDKLHEKTCTERRFQQVFRQLRHAVRTQLMIADVRKAGADVQRVTAALDSYRGSGVHTTAVKAIRAATNTTERNAALNRAHDRAEALILMEGIAQNPSGDHAVSFRLIGQRHGWLVAPLQPLLLKHLREVGSAQDPEQLYQLGKAFRLELANLKPQAQNS